MFRKILIANRGEIACRVIKTCKNLGITTVAVYSDADKNAQHVKQADEAVHIGESQVSKSYLLMDKIIEVAKATGAEAIHPGYGFLSENDQFAKACADNSIVFIGPPVEAILAMGLKATSKALMEKANVPLTPGYHGENQDPNFLKEQADRIGYPVLIKASAGGGGKGMSLVERAEDFLESLSSCKREALSSFGNDDVLIERYIVNPRHVEVQIFGDSFGNVVHLFERDCSVQRRHQKVIEEAPALNISDEKLAQMRTAAINAGRAVGYVGAGTVEFIVEQDGTAYFMEMNTRLQVEHPVTEMITGVDLVEWQLRVAYGKPLPKSQDELTSTGHALEARIYAEIPEQGYLPATGKITYLSYPNVTDSVRIDSGIVAGDEITTFYDPMIAKLIVWGKNRDEAIGKLRHALSQTHIDGLGNNIAFLERILRIDSFKDVKLDTNLIAREEDFLLRPTIQVDDELIAKTAFIKLLSGLGKGSIWQKSSLWRLNTPTIQTVKIVHQDETYVVTFSHDKDVWTANVGDKSFTLTGSLTDDHTADMTIDGKCQSVAFSQSADGVTVFDDRFGANAIKFTHPKADYGTDDDGDSGGLTAPMPGVIVDVRVSSGQSVTKDEILLTMEAMKIVYTIKAPEDGMVSEVYYQAGDQVKAGDELVAFTPNDQ
ncbi:acetyl/propionyl/methylcrotonyl-CoA carboxylase subunit alpha [Moraxella ovis]|uniref:acetyl/propionyl/methylcrotonyl-CoA carboxylase subunit alpha n=1 Tax=Moraxella ovis TaxID=29433 RepID=UPI000D9FEA96|nr:acetyl/propionyl/methylcrotonyl-CoA carboxylase subunit alpha [Moraxella ovis]SPX80966.1 Acetyl-/propionyl-coenzyme A carboxylase alpha chain [Moraxella ovis]STZ06055.1 Acetyl-/propionyl-coenzyme A carboxylase alpha chain [Moraxella ovis]